MAEDTATKKEAKQDLLAEDYDPCAGENWHPGKAWAAAIAAVVFLLMGSGSLNMLTPVLKLLLADFGLDTNYGSTLSSIHTVTSFIVALPVGWALNKYGFRKLGFVGYIVLIISGVWGAVCNDAVSMCIVRVLQGIGYCVPPVLGVYLCTQWFPKDKVGIPVALVAQTSALAKTLFLQISKITIPAGTDAFGWGENGGWRMQFVFFAVICVIGLVLFIFFAKPGPGQAVADAQRLAKEQKKAGQEKAPLLVVLKNPWIWAITIMYVFFNISQRGFSPFQNMIFVDNCGVSNDTASDINSLWSMMKIPSGLICGWILGSLIGKNRGKISAVIMTIFFLSMPFAFSLSSEPAAWAWAAISGLTGGVAGYANVSMTIVSKSPAELAMGVAFFTWIGKYLSGTIAPYIVSFAKEFSGGWESVFPLMLGAGIAGAAICWALGFKMDKTDKQKAAEEAAA